MLQAVLTRMTVPLASVMALQPGEVLALPSAALDRISFEGIDGRKVAEGRLGQNRGLRALRLTPPAPSVAPSSKAVAPAPPPQPVVEPLRQAG